MAVYKFSFGEVTVADGMPAFSPEVLQWVEEQAKERMGAALRTVIDEALLQSMSIQVPLDPVPVTESAE